MVKQEGSKSFTAIEFFDFMVREISLMETADQEEAINQARANALIFAAAVVTSPADQRGAVRTKLQSLIAATANPAATYIERTITLKAVEILNFAVRNTDARLASRER